MLIMSNSLIVYHSAHVCSDAKASAFVIKLKVTFVYFFKFTFYS